MLINPFLNFHGNNSNIWDVGCRRVYPRNFQQSHRHPF